jgi:hypothetical protein
MELTTQQIHQVEIYLDKKRFNFIDLKVEVLDHMISDIENHLNKNISFENAFKITILKWNTHFKDTSSFFFGFQYSESKIVVKNAVKMFKPFYLLYLVAYILPMIIFTNISIIFPRNTIDFLNGFLNSISAVFFCYLIYIIIKVIKSKVKTTYRFILKTQYLGIIFLILPLFMRNHFNDNGSLIPFLISFQSAGFAVTYICHYFFKKHEEAIKKYKIS